VNPLHHQTLAESARRLRSGDLSPVALTQAYLERIAALNPQLHAFVLPTQERALAEAHAAEAEIAAGKWRGPLHGIPIGFKDIFDTAGVGTSCGSRVLRDRVPGEDAHCVALLKRAGAIMLGKLTTDEFAFGGGSPDAAFPAPRNPWDVERTPSGSSSGSAVAVAAGMCAGATGSDTGGSIRGPAASCGIAGIKPTYGLVSRRGVFPLAHTADTCGPMTWTSEDCALLLQAMAGYDPQDPASVDTAVPDFAAEIAKPVSGLRVGVVRNFYTGTDSATPETIALIDDALKVLGDLGASVREVELPSLLDFHACGRAVILSEMYAVHRATLLRSPDLYGRNARERLRLGAFVGGEEYVRAQRFRRVLTERTLQAMEGIDLLVTAGGYDAPEPLAAAKIFPYFDKPYPTIAFNMTGQPALAVCCGFGAEGLPRSIQIAGRHFEDALVLRLGHAYERATPWRERRPLL
jgi:aspartyl-tRNA(Asn)/glutamyl-tRNA(Gln) amidotransferase subunit A